MEKWNEEAVEVIIRAGEKSDLSYCDWIEPIEDLIKSVDILADEEYEENSMYNEDFYNAIRECKCVKHYLYTGAKIPPMNKDNILHTLSEYIRLNRKDTYKEDYVVLAMLLLCILEEMFN